MKHIIEIFWSGSFKVDDVRLNYKDGGNDQNGLDGPDYGLYQIYGKHILYGKKKENVLLYIGKTIDQTFSKRFQQHKEWLDEEFEGLEVRLGRLVDAKYQPTNNWATWCLDVGMAEAILIYKYTPCYNASLKASFPKLRGCQDVVLEHAGERGHLEPQDKAPNDYRKMEIFRGVGVE